MEKEVIQMQNEIGATAGSVWMRDEAMKIYFILSSF